MSGKELVNSEGYQRVDFHLRSYGYSVRAVLAE